MVGIDEVGRARGALKWNHTLSHMWDERPKEAELVAPILNVGVIGLGRSGFHIHVQGLVNHPRVRVAAVADGVRERVDEAVALTGCRGYGDYRDLLADPEVDVVVVATPTHTHAPIAREALAAGKHVVVEKVMATSSAEADEMIAAAAAANKVLTVFQNSRVMDEFQKVKGVVDSGRLGRIAQVKLGRYFYSRRNDWQTLTKYGGGLLHTHGAHVIDMGMQLVPDVEVVYAELRQNVSFGDADDHVKAVMRGRDGTILDIEIFQDCAVPGPSWHITGQHGALVVQGGIMTVKWVDPTRLTPLEVSEGPAAGRRYAAETIEWQTETAPIAGDHRTGDWYNFLYGTLVEGKPLFVSPESVRSVIRVFEAMRQMAGV